ncbi:hypothetical protein [Bosea sp. (in: a-proteobacteria)]|uniref:hypothetical protein n=1 Tax=Bosea sp. (in: a-proteobacteria) TaxID=1871050 RepID=UPI003B3BCA34
MGEQTDAAVPGLEEIARLIYHAKPRLTPWEELPHDFKNQYRKPARKIADLFAPILAEKEREIERACADHANATIGWECERGLREAAEAALAGEREPHVEIRRNDDGLIDEMIAKGVTVHLEQMEAGAWFLGLDAGEKTWQFWLRAKNAKTRVDIYHEQSAAIRAKGE